MQKKIKWEQWAGQEAITERVALGADWSAATSVTFWVTQELKKRTIERWVRKPYGARLIYLCCYNSGALTQCSDSTPHVKPFNQLQ